MCAAAPGFLSTILLEPGEAIVTVAAGDTTRWMVDVLLALVDIYEEKRWPIDPSKDFDPVDALHYAINELGHTQAELAELLGSRSRASEILARRRALTVDMIHKINEEWKIPADLLVRPYKL